MAYNYEDNIPQWGNEGTEPVDRVKTEGYKPGYKPPASYFNWFWSHVLKWLNDLRTKLSSLHTQVGSLETKVTTLENKDYDISAESVLAKIKTVDGAESGLDADMVDGKHASEFAPVDHTHTQYATSTHSHPLATETSNGFMSSEMYNKLNEIDLENMTTYTHPSTHPASMITESADVAKTGNYADLINKPTLSAVATSNDYNDLINKPSAYTHPATHPASMIEETTNCKIMTADERAKLAGIVAGANNYIHPDTHPASMITGLTEYITSLGYGKVASGSYTGNGSGISYVTTNPTSVSMGSSDKPYGYATSIIAGKTTAYDNSTTEHRVYKNMRAIPTGMRGDLKGVFLFSSVADEITFLSTQTVISTSGRTKSVNNNNITELIGLDDTNIYLIGRTTQSDEDASFDQWDAKIGFNRAGYTYYWLAF